MTSPQRAPLALPKAVAAALLAMCGIGGTPAQAQTATAPGVGAPAAASPSAASGGGSIASDPNPYSLGVSQAITHDSNVYRTVAAVSDTYSSTSLFGGFDQPIGRQRIFGNASVSANRYWDQTALDNESYNLSAGLAWSTINKLSGSLNASLNRGLAAPAVAGIIPVETRNIATTRSVDATARLGGESLLTLEGAYSHSKANFEESNYARTESTNDSASIAIYYRSSALRVGIAGRGTRTDTPRALLLPGGGTRSNTVRSKNVDLLADYAVSGLINAAGRLSYTKQDDSFEAGADFSGFTGSLSLGYQPSGKLSYNLQWARDTGFNASPFTSYTPTQIGPIVVLTPINGLWENNQLTDSLGLSIGYAATGKVSASAALRYSRARLATSLLGIREPRTTDINKGVFLSANYAISLRWNANCSAGHEDRRVSGAINYSYSANTVGCSAQYTWR